MVFLLSRQLCCWTDGAALQGQRWIVFQEHRWVFHYSLPLRQSSYNASFSFPDGTEDTVTKQTSLTKPLHLFPQTTSRSDHWTNTHTGLSAFCAVTSLYYSLCWEDDAGLKRLLMFQENQVAKETLQLWQHQDFTLIATAARLLLTVPWNKEGAGKFRFFFIWNKESGSLRAACTWPVSKAVTVLRRICQQTE